MDQERPKANHKRKGGKTLGRKLSQIGFMAVYGSVEHDCARKRRYYRKRRYLCPGKRRYKAKVRNRPCCRKYNHNRINICNRNWARISVHPFINFLRCFRKRFPKETPPSEILRRGKSQWRKMSCGRKLKYYEQAKRARIRGYRT